jgi:hypothetical protein
MRGYSQANHQPYSSNGGWINPGNTQWISPLSLAGSALRCRKRTAPGPRQPLLARFQASSGSWSKMACSSTMLKPTACWWSWVVMVDIEDAELEKKKIKTREVGYSKIMNMKVAQDDRLEGWPLDDVS